jgi:hypothetical protein
MTGAFIMRYYTVFAVIFFMLSSCSTIAPRDAYWVSSDKAVLIAKHEIAKLGWLHHDNELKIEILNEHDARKANRKSPKASKDVLVDKLKDFKYWKVIFDLKPGVPSNESDAVVFVNRRDGSILSIYFGEIKGKGR